MRFISSFTAALLTAFVAASLAVAEQGPRRITLAKDRSHVSVGGSVNHGERIDYVIVARAGQKMEVHILSIGSKASIAIYEPQSERAVRGVEEGREVTQWAGLLLKSGDYRVAVSSAKGNSHYRLGISLK